MSVIFSCKRNIPPKSTKNGQPLRGGGFAATPSLKVQPKKTRKQTPNHIRELAHSQKHNSPIKRQETTALSEGVAAKPPPREGTLKHTT